MCSTTNLSVVKRRIRQTIHQNLLFWRCKSQTSITVFKKRYLRVALFCFVLFTTDAQIIFDDLMMDDLMMGDLMMGDLMMGDLMMGDLMMGDLMMGDLMMGDLMMGDLMMGD